MTLNLFKLWRERRKQKQKLQDYKNLLQTWTWLEQVFQSGMLTFDEKAHRLFITQPLAVLLMSNGADGWVNSIHNIYQYAYLRQSQKLWDEFIKEKEMAAVKDAMNSPSGDSINRDDIERIKRARRSEIAVSDMEPPRVEPFEFFIVPDSTEAKVEPIGIGHYDPNTKEMEVASWEEVKGYLGR